jgi:hypothetical protein
MEAIGATTNYGNFFLKKRWGRGYKRTAVSIYCTRMLHNPDVFIVTIETQGFLLDVIDVPVGKDIESYFEWDKIIGKGWEEYKKEYNKIEWVEF